ncbi:hypothetical protein SJA_C2-01090 [Sphingobium indicum UT26S]|uniref:DUF3142 domain-containing protein n=1 Tax=Sphingobium indicum (strain DSM 16413 / CCM 7287 / MTCC 6362 / UT26 / NBRC 101211 / UT26S) TaxID=452662 RepID=D4Z7K3_SPHIU|nr:hypothetical protein SJA_C2-01090 [Sphingobium indicum UT26S]
MRAGGWATALLALLALSGCQRQAETGMGTVDPAAHDAFYLWPGVRPAGNVRPKILYLLDGEVRRGGPPRLERLRMGTPRLPGKKVWLVVRADRLDWNDALYAMIFDDLNRWREAGNEVVGLQVDFDAATRGIDGYACFLHDLRRRLPQDWRLSITGLMDWSAHGDPHALTRLAGLVDEVVVQTYQGRTTILGYEDYFRRMEGFPIPFRVALVEGGAWQAPPMLSHHPQFKGYVVFLLTRTPSDER